MDIEDCMDKRSPLAPKNVAKAKNVPVITTKRNRENSQDSDEDLTKSWRQVLGKAMKSSPLLGPFCGSEFWGFSLLKI